MRVALLRYLAADVLRGERWAPPVVTFLAATAVLDSGGGSALSCYGTTSTLLLPVSLWLAVGVVHSEEPAQAAVTVAAVGGPGRVLLARLVTAYLGCLVPVLVAVAWPPVAGHPHTAPTVAYGAAAHLTTAAAGVAFGALLCRPIVRRMAWTLLGGVVLSLVDILVPDAPPAHQVLSVFEADHPAHVARSMASTALQTAVLVAAVVDATHRLSRSRL